MSKNSLLPKSYEEISKSGKNQFIRIPEIN